MKDAVNNMIAVSTHSRPKAAGETAARQAREENVSTHSRPKAAGVPALYAKNPEIVSTHSRPKAAGMWENSATSRFARFNSQPPEGGWPPPCKKASSA